MERIIDLPIIKANNFKTHNVQHCNENYPYTFHFELALVQGIALKDILDGISLPWLHSHVLPERNTRNINPWLVELIRTGGDFTGIWSYTFQIGVKDFATFAMHRRNHSISFQGYLQKCNGRNSCSLYITLFEPPSSFLDFWHSDTAKEMLEIVEYLEAFALEDSRSTLRPTLSFGFPQHIVPRMIGFKLFHELLFTPQEPIHIPVYMYDNENASWKMRVVKRSGDKTIDTKVVKETIKTPKGVFNITRPATDKEIKQQKKEAKKVKREKLQNRLDRQKLDLEKLKEELEATQKALAIATESSQVSANRQKKELEQLHKKLERLRRNKDSEIALKDAEIEEIQNIADEIIAAGDEAKEQLQNANWQIQNLNAQVQGLKQRQSAGGFINSPLQEQEKFPGEFEIAVMSALHFASDNAPSKANSFGLRRQDVWKVLIQANPHAETLYSNYKKEISSLLDATKKNNFWRNLAVLPRLGMACSQHANNHKKVHFADEDGRYSCTIASTPSETVAGPANFADELKNAFFYY